MKVLKLLGIVLISFSFSQCGASKFDKNPPFTITEAIFNNWVGGQPGVSGTKIMLEYKNDSNVSFDSIYFKNKVAKVELYEQVNKTYLIGHYSTSNGLKGDLILDINSKKELHNKIPKKDKIPFEIKENEAVLSYQENGKTKYFKIKKVKQVKSASYQ